MELELKFSFNKVVLFFLRTLTQCINIYKDGFELFRKKFAINSTGDS